MNSFEEGCRAWANGFYSNEEIRNTLIERIEIVQATDGTINFNEEQAISFIQSMARSGPDQGINWTPLTREKHKFYICSFVFHLFLDMVADKTKHLPKFSIN